MGELFHNAKEGEPIISTLEEMVHSQQATPIQTDNKPHRESQIKASRKRGPNNLIYCFIEYKIKSSRATTTFFRNQEQPIWPNISPNIIHLTIIVACAQYIYTVQAMQIMKV